MNRIIRLTTLPAVLLCSWLAPSRSLASCINEGPYEVRQCAVGTWFAPPPSGAGPIASARWWAVGFGNATRSLPSGSPESSGFAGIPFNSDGFIGVDSGSLDAAGLDLVDATTIGGIGAPPGSSCFSSRANWGSPGIDSCIDVNRTAAGPGGPASTSDNYLNPYFEPSYGPGYFYRSAQLDPPMGILLTESSGRYFALAFFASAPRRPPLETDIDSGQLHMSEIINGDPGPTGDNVVPWQPVPQPAILGVVPIDPSDWRSPRMVFMTWQPVRLVHDGSSRPCLQTDGVTPCASLGGSTGAGVLDQGPLVHYQIELAPFDHTIFNCGTSWTPVPGTLVDQAPQNPVAVELPRDYCLRLTTLFGRTPIVTPCPGICIVPINFRNQAQQGKMGDVGYQVNSRPTIIGGPLLSENIHLTAVTRLKGNDLRIAFDTDTELNISFFEVVGIDSRGGRRILGTVPCEQCTSGVSAIYDVTLDHARFQGSKSIVIVARPTGRESNVLSLR